MATAACVCCDATVAPCDDRYVIHKTRSPHIRRGTFCGDCAGGACYVIADVDESEACRFHGKCDD